MSVNKVILLGRTGDDVKLHRFDNDGCVGNVSLATSSSYTNDEGEKITNTEWHSLVFKNKAAEVVEQHLHKGDQVYVEGYLKTRTWELPQGGAGYKTEVHVTHFTFLPNKRD